MSSTIPNLRPLSVGEIFDRALSIYVKNIVVFSALLIVVVLPFWFIQYLASRDMFQIYLNVLTEIIRAGPGAAPPNLDKLARQLPNFQPLLGIGYLFALIALPLANAAVVIAVSRAYLGRPIRFVDCYRTALNRALHVILLVFLWLVAFILALTALLVILFVLGIIFVPIVHILKTLGTLVAAIFGLAALIALLVMSAILYMAVAFSFVATVLERTDPVHALFSSFTRIFGAKQFWRSVAVSFSLFAVVLGVDLVALGVGGLLFFATKSAVAYFIVSGIAEIFFYAFLFAVVSVYYYDIRIRREGLDLRLLADQVAGSSEAASVGSL